MKQQDECVNLAQVVEKWRCCHQGKEISCPFKGEEFLLWLRNFFSLN